MSLISNSALQAIGDKMARYVSEAVGDPAVVSGLTAGFTQAAIDVLSGATAANNLAKYVLAIADEDVVADLLPAARNLDETNPTPADGFLLTIPELAAMITALNTHLKRYGGAAGLDAYLTALNASTPTLRFHGNFRTYLKTISAKNCFIPSDMEIARVNVTGATAGTYTHLAAIATSQFGGAKLVVKNVGAITGTTGISITGKKFDGTTATLTASIATLTDGFETDLSDVTKVFVDVTAIAISSGGTAGNVIKIVAKTDRSIAAA
jgi:hypothetical protein